MTNCKSLVEDTLLGIVFMKFPQMMSLYSNLLSTNFINRSANLRLCPSCGETLKLLQSGNSAVTCPCGHAFCFPCGHPDHFHVPSWMTGRGKYSRIRTRLWSQLLGQRSVQHAIWILRGSVAARIWPVLGVIANFVGTVCKCGMIIITVLQWKKTKLKLKRK